MRPLEKSMNITGACLFGLFGITALVAVIFLGAYHHFVTVFACSIMVFVFIVEIRNEERKIKQSNK